ncbi:MAG: anti-sigma regulatory factor [Clostridiales bacterium]|nr:anti-sigma regulatory factor [Clostridiales bacterium]
MGEYIDRISLKLPFKPEYVSIARLAVSGIASRMGFDIETIEDIKVSISEVCNKLVETGSKVTPDYEVSFGIFKEELSITFNADDDSLGCIFRDSLDDLGISLITAFMDQVELCPDNDYILSMTKALEGIGTDGK